MSEPAKPKTPVHKFSFTGTFGEVFLLTIKNTIFTILTIGLYLPYARTNMRKYIWKSSRLAGHPFLFHADPKNLFKGYLLLGGIVLLSLMVSGGLTALAPQFAPLFKFIPTFVIFCLVLRARFGAYAYLVNNTSYRSIRFNVNKDGVWEYMGAVLKGSFLTVFTAGLYAPFVSANLSRIKWKHTKFGNVPFKFTMKNWDYALHCYKSIFFCVITFGLYLPWAAVSVHKFKMKHVRFQGAQLVSTASGLSVIGLYLRSLILVVFSLGLAAPYVTNMVLAFYLNNLKLKGELDFDGIMQIARGKDDGLQDSIADAFDVDVDVA